jgi:hypothetical protein
LDPLPGGKQRQEGNHCQRDRQHQTKAARGALLGGFNWPEWEIG